MKSGQTRTRVAHDHALITPDTFVKAPLPAWIQGTCVMHISPEMGAGFTQYTALLEMGAVGRPPVPGVQRLVYVLEGKLILQVERKDYTLRTDSFAYLPANTPHAFEALVPSRLVVIEKPFKPLEGVPAPYVVVGREPELNSKALEGDEALQVRKLLPDEMPFDMAVNTMEYLPGATLPFVETHVMEHGLLMLAGGGIYRLGDSWYLVEAGDTIWMRAYCPQWFGALGKIPAKYLIYKDMNRDPLKR
jgi:(S)-ureidoglycine aminohydrolase